MTTGSDAQSRLLRRWLTALGLVATAEDVVRRGDDAASSTALIVADSAAETLLGVIGVWTDESLPPEPKYHQVMERARHAMEAAGLRLPLALQQDLRSVHALRNAVVHHGAVAPESEASLACQAARQLLDLMPALSENFVAVPAGGGVATAIAALLDAPDLTALLVAGEAALRRGAATEAADATTRAHTALLFRLDPPLGAPPSELWFTDKRGLGKAGDYLDGIGKSLAQIQGWVVASAVGMHPAAYRRLHAIMGTHIRYMGGNDRIARHSEPTLDDARWALTRLAEMAFRLWQQGALLEGTWDDIIEHRYGVRPPRPTPELPAP